MKQDNDAVLVSFPNVERHNPDPNYLRQLLDEAGLSQQEAARRLGVSVRMMRYYLAEEDGKPAPYLVQFGLEALAAAGRKAQS